MGEKLSALPLVREIKGLTERKFDVHPGGRPARKTNAGVDFTFIFALAVLLVFGLVMIYSASSYYSLRDSGNTYSMFFKQIVATVIGLVLFGVAAFFDYRKYARNKYLLILLYIGSVAAMFFLLVKGRGGDEYGATRWIPLGPFNFQPVELFKIASIAVTAFFIAKDPASFNVGAKKKRRADDGKPKRFKSTGLMVKYYFHKAYVNVLLGIKYLIKSRSMQLIVLCGIIPAIMSLKISNNLSSAITLFLIPVLMTFLVNRNKKGYYILFACIGIVIVCAMLYGKFGTPPADNFRLRRLCAWMRPEEFADTGAYQTLQARYAIGAGGILGKGIGKSLQKLSWIPEAQNDMIFAVICEELGIFGAIMTVVMFALLLWRIRVIAKRSPDRLGSLLCMGVFIHVAIQVFVNIGVATGLIVNTGVTLPFISYGGSSVLFLLIEMGLVMSVARRAKLKA